MKNLQKPLCNLPALHMCGQPMTKLLVHLDPKNIYFIMEVTTHGRGMGMFSPLIPLTDGLLNFFLSAKK
jgi:hypothetical protein